MEAGIHPKKARELMISMLCLLEGAFVLSRAMRSTDPLEIAGETATAAVRDAPFRGAPRRPPASEGEIGRAR